MIATTPNLEAIANAISARRFVFTRESELQDAIHSALLPHKPEREARIPYAGRIDFLVGRVGVEVKIDGSLSTVASQVLRYARSGAIDALLLVTTKRGHVAVEGKRLGVPIRVLVLTGGLG